MDCIFGHEKRDPFSLPAKRSRTPGARNWVHQLPKQVRQEWDHTPKAREHLDQTGEALNRGKHLYSPTQKGRGKMGNEWEKVVLGVGWKGGTCSNVFYSTVMRLVHSFVHFFIHCFFLYIFTCPKPYCWTLLGLIWDAFLKEVGCLVMLDGQVEKR